MWPDFTLWFKSDYIEIAGTIAGFIYIYFQIKEDILLWPFGLISSALFIYVYFNTKLYADMALYVYYVIVSIYGWIYWKKGREKTNEKKLPIVSPHTKTFIVLFLIAAGLFAFIAYVLINHTDSPAPYLDSFTTSLSIVGTWMLAKKILQHWLVWIIVDATSVGLYFYKEIYYVTTLFVVYTILAVVGYIAWKKEYRLQHG